MNEAETRAEYIDPALKAGGWGVVAVGRIRHLETICEQKLALLEELKKSLLHQAFAGKL